ncbi:hypothetical protein H072_6717 [Dactylellina haptotyla CBS 200.50]|uniref:FMR1-interacting protein 1 conserved domain-containing protein n=1 Tax=Dactylellina haptotyla (strain CBS 200.50) TaxID=1284197 RepID=S8BW44_DACHA|nr:hypothetical protein H072_6717 [Dactylellina haptotyla CBS 200.50]
MKNQHVFIFFILAWWCNLHLVSGRETFSRRDGTPYKEEIPDSWVDRKLCSSPKGEKNVQTEYTESDINQPSKFLDEYLVPPPKEYKHRYIKRANEKEKSRKRPSQGSGGRDKAAIDEARKEKDLRSEYRRARTAGRRNVDYEEWRMENPAQESSIEQGEMVGFRILPNAYRFPADLKEWLQAINRIRVLKDETSY